jgi:hypothetical protein
MRKAEKLFIMLFRKRSFTPNVGICILWHLIPGSLHTLQWSIDERLELGGAKILLTANQELVRKTRGSASKCNALLSTSD